MPYIDLQVNGYCGVDFNADDLSAEDLHAACQRLRADSVEGVLATVITAELDQMTRRIDRIVQLRQQDPLACEVIRGIHIEGPFINETAGYVGAHPREAVRVADVDATERLLEAAGGLTRLVTLAPERDPDLKVTRLLVERGIRVAAGHCDASLDELRAAVDAGLSMFTHLGNGCPMHMHRHDNIVQRALSLADRLWTCFIADGHHVPAVALGNYLRLTGMDRAIIVTDATAATGLGPGRYSIGSRRFDVGDDFLAWAPDRSHYIGSTATMPRIVEILRTQLGLSDHAIRRLTYENPCTVLGGGSVLRF